MLLFDMSEADLERGYEQYSNRLYNRYYGLDKPERCCENCKEYYGGFCFLKDEAGEEKDPDDCCDMHGYKESDYPDYMDGD